MAPKVNKPSYDELVDLIKDLRAENATLKERLTALEKENANLREQLARANKNSSNSSKPPSSDIVKPKNMHKDRGKKHVKRKIGGQPGHEKHERVFELSDADEEHWYTLAECPHGADSPLIPLPDKMKTIYQYELVEKPILLHAHIAGAYWCEECCEIHYAEIPTNIRKAGLVGERLTSFIGFLKGGCHTSYSRIRTLLGDAFATDLSEGMIAKVIQKASKALSTPYAQLLDQLWQEEHLNIDETGHKENGKLMWTWCFRAKGFTLFHIAGSRGSVILQEILGKDCAAVIGCDHFSAYLKFMKDAPIVVQFCLAHLIRELKFLTQSHNKHIAAYGNRLLTALKRIFKLIHKREEMAEERFRMSMENLRDDFLKMACRTRAGGEAATLAKRFRKYGKEYFTFTTEPGIDPTNNVAEQAIRFCVIDRKITQGTRSIRGRHWCERFWTVMATCTQQGRSAFKYISQAVHALFSKTEAPSLLPTN